ncbi:bacillithiol biosynthesis deacetylase BshB1 [Alkalicoccus daliensis]|uniref:Bacillithiol biosynthesis deacetylase BshB1 n=1 Tax=Alkalicoccus daliensis TaxID=745820 RepID=A0A1H0ATE4_9BACI|nr:bacillithiol biosynthesis deacetylase BshB1 [Alkalicoccus daliensis]SDN36664.1 bacillithiol biosynthesis deacetylase BshB1 [Alkalicoccus daliensis]
MKADILAVGAHPDDIEIGMGGTIAKAAANGKTVVMAHLTKAELSSNGSVEERLKESAAAAKVLGAEKPLSYSFSDRGLLNERKEAIAALVKLIREVKPVHIFAPYHEDRHPDHGHCGEIVKEAFFSAGIKKYGEGESFKPEALYYYQINGLIKPDFAIDISAFMNQKYEALACFASQFQSGKNKVETPLTNGYLDDLRARDRLLGRETGVSSAEGFVSERLLLYPFPEKENKE